MSAFGGEADVGLVLTSARPNDTRFWRGPMLHNRELIFAVVIVNIPMARLRLFARLRRRFARWQLGHRSTPSVGSSPHMFVVNYSSAANSQFGLRWRESNSGHNEENLQHE